MRLIFTIARLTVLEMLRRELLLVMRQAGTRRRQDIDRSYIVDRRSSGPLTP